MRRFVSLGLGAVLAMAVVAAPSPLAAGAGASVCDAKARPANFGFTLKDMNGKDVALSAYRGKVILLDFWATWCGPCKIEIPGFVDMYNRYGPDGFVVLGVSVDDTVAKLKPFVARYRMNYPVLLGLDRDDVKDAFGPLVGFPTSLLIGRDGTICQRHVGYTPKDEFERAIKALLAKPA